MRKALRAVETRRRGWAPPEGLGTWLAQPPASRDAQGCMGGLGFGLPGMASAAGLCIRRGLGGSDPFTGQGSFLGFVPFP